MRSRYYVYVCLQWNILFLPSLCSIPNHKHHLVALFSWPMRQTLSFLNTSILFYRYLILMKKTLYAKNLSFRDIFATNFQRQMATISLCVQSKMFNIKLFHHNFSIFSRPPVRFILANEKAQKHCPVSLSPIGLTHLVDTETFMFQCASSVLRYISAHDMIGYMLLKSVSSSIPLTFLNSRYYR